MLFFSNRRILVIALLGVSSGLPLALTTSTLQAWFTEAGISITAIGALSLVGMPYAWKFVWSPVMDRFIPPFLDRRRGWILITQIALCAGLLFLGNLKPTEHPSFMGILALVIAFFSASQDIAFDAYRTDILLPKERGLGAAYYILGYRIAMLLSGGLALIFADHLGWRLTYDLMAIIILGLALVSFWAPKIPNSIHPPASFLAAIVDPFKNLFAREAILIILLFIILYKMGDAFALSLMSTFLLRDLGFSLTEVGLAYKTGGLLATIIGALIGGTLLPRLGLFRSLWYFGIAQALSNLLFMVLAMAGKSYWLMFSSIFIENFCSGMSTAALVALLMELCHRQYSATQFACLSALAAIGRIFCGPIAAKLILALGWVNFFGWTFLFCLPGLMLLMLLRNRMFHVEAITS